MPSVVFVGAHLLKPIIILTQSAPLPREEMLFFFEKSNDGDLHRYIT